ncbi:YagK/YfjJ domain-containing protein [Moritella viscosa]|uniref:YagK/YfjJ C-terminal domain-containing protein n=1 Tax=Moritella viscosa TaxID=80854 RepID=A0ABY1H978_9GAMM|nr:inovirus-type Gp2 protein [Moritella viscosa]SGY84975.1 Putative uncharacterized protein [Moritella viscosa]SGZ18968.1 Putative uncharacterized protein [Moritella viscosa]SHO28488.1 Putative uncharacterized protein [Moritella viscosa]
MCQISLHQSKKFLAYYQYKNEQQLIFHKRTGIRKEILEQGFKQLDIMMTEYSKVSVILLQLHPDRFTEDNATITQFLVQLKKKLIKKYNSKIGYLWVREQNKAEAQHYHLVIMINGHKCNNAYTVSQLCDEAWEGPTDTNFAFRIRNRLYRIEQYKNNRNELRAARMRMSYMAKNETKHFSKNTNSFGVSRLKSKTT